jgi:hypothetical protein
MFIKLALQRSNDLAILVGLVYVLNGLWDDIASERKWISIAAATTLVSPFLLHPGFPVLHTLVLTAPAWKIFTHEGTGKRLRNWIVPAFALCFGGLIFAYKLTGIAGTWKSGAYTGGKYLLGALLILSAWVVTQRLMMRYVNSGKLMRSVTIGMVVVLAVLWLQHKEMRPEQRNLAASYQQVQLWARENTKNEALFMTDPTIYYGWRDFSQRSSFGNLREWLYAGWCYTSDFTIYQEGMKRFREFSLDIEPFLHEKPPLNGFYKLSDAVEKRYYTLGDEWRNRLAKRYGIDYFVLIKQRMTGLTRMSIAFENDLFLVLEPAPVRIKHAAETVSVNRGQSLL